MKKLVNLFMVMLIFMMVTACGINESVLLEEMLEPVAPSENNSETDAEDNQPSVEDSQEVTSDSVSAEEEISDSESVPEGEISEESESVSAESSADEQFEQEFAQMKYYEEEGVRNNALFGQFLDGEVTALSYETKENWFCKDFYKDAYENYYHNLYGVHIFSEDLNGDGVKELLLLVLYASDGGNLYVFREDAGTLKAWEVFEDFVWMRVGNLYLHENGMIESHSGYGAGHSFYKYNDNGQLELLLFDYYTSNSVEGGTEYRDTVYVYENNVQVNQLDTVIFMADNSDEMIFRVGNEEINAEMNRMVKELKESSPVAREFYQHHWED